MTDSSHKWLTTLIVACCGLAVFLPTIDWGLPSRETDRALFGDRKAWTGREILELLESRVSLSSVESADPLPRTRGRGQGEGESAGRVEVTSELSSDRPLTLTLSPDYRGEGTGNDSSAISSFILLPSSLRGADVDANPILDRSQPVILNDTDVKRAEIVQRYRLMSQQPDEFIQFKALAEMSQRQGISKLDPRLYQYGGLWIYPVGALVRTAMLVGYIESPPVGVSAKEFYLDHPDVFGKFYIVARAYSTMWGIVAAIAIASITRRLTNSHLLAFLAAIAFILLPVTRTAAHEAKPHLAGAALCLCAVIAGTRYAESGKRRYAILAGALCGAAMAMVVSMLLSLAVLPMMVWMRWRNSRGCPGACTHDPRTPVAGQRVRCPGAPGGTDLNSPPLAGGAGGRGRDAQSPAENSIASDAQDPSPNPSREGRGVVVALICACASAFVIYALTNPFLLYNAVFHPEILKSNLGNSTAMYGVGGMADAITSALRIAIAGMTLGGVILAGLSLTVLTIASLPFSRDARVARTRAPGAMDEYPHPCSASDRVYDEPSEARVSVLTRGTRSVSPVGWILAAPAVCVLIQFVLLAAGKPAEYARFGLVAAAWMVCLAACMIALAKKPRPVEWLIVAAILLLTYVIVVPVTSKRMSRRALPWMSALVAGEPPTKFGKSFWTLGLSHEPAPWSVMPLNLFRDQLILTKPAADPKSAIYDVYLYPSNLGSQIGLGGDGESVDWARNHTGMTLGSLPPPPTQATSRATR